MIDLLRSLDIAVFRFVNSTIANPVFDRVFPALTDWNQSAIGWAVVASLWLLLMWKGGRKGRIVGLLIIPLVAATDQTETIEPASAIRFLRAERAADGE